MNAQADLFANRPAVERPYYQTTPLSMSDLLDAVEAAERQDDAVLAILRYHRASALAPSTVHYVGQQAGRKWLITSVRRSMTNLERAGLLRKAGVVDGPHGRPEHTWSLA